MSLNFDSMPDGDLNLFASNLFDKATDSATAWHISAGSLLTLSVPLDDWNIKYPLTLDPATKTSLAVSDKKISRKALIEALRPFVRDEIYENTFMDATDRLACMCPEHSTNRTPYGTPTTIPRGAASPSPTGAFRVLLEVTNEDGARPSRSLPPGVAMVLVRCKVGGPPPTVPEDCPIVILSSTTRITIERTAAEIGQILYMFICWVGNNGSQGQFIVQYIQQAIA